MVPERPLGKETPLLEQEPGLRPVAIRAVETYQEIFGEDPDAMAVGKPRVEFVGNVTDKLPGGHAIGFALKDVGTIAAVGQGTNGKIRVFSEAYAEDGLVEVDVGDLEYSDVPRWAKYVLGTIFHTHDLVVEDLGEGINIVICSNATTSGGISSSAALEMAVGLAVLDMHGIQRKDLTDTQVVHAFRSAEVDDRFVGGSCGYLDQACSISDGGVLLEFKTQDDGAPYGAKPVDLSVIEQEGYRVVIGIGGGVERVLDQTGYPHKAEVAQRALEKLRQFAGKQVVNIHDLRTYSQFVESDAGYEAYRALSHLLAEDERVLTIARQLEKGRGNQERTYALITRSGESSLGKYGVADAVESLGVEAVPQLPFLVQLALQSGAKGARNHGGGWNANFLAIIHESALEEVEERIAQGYQTKFGAGVEFIEARVGQGSQAIPVLNVK